MRRGLVVSTLVVACVAIVGLAVLWPRGPAPDLGPQPNVYVDGTVIAVERTECEVVEVEARTGCLYAVARLTSGPQSGDDADFVVRDVDLGAPAVAVDDEVVLLDLRRGAPPYRYVFAEFQRSTSLWWLAGLFAVVVVAFGRWQGVRALLGLGASVVVIGAFVVPAVLRDEPAILVALTGAVVVAFVALYLAHGPTLATTVALVGTLLSLGLIVALATVVVGIARLTGLADSQAQVLRVTADALDLRGLLVAGIVIGALGVLDDVTVTQVSTVVALRRAQPDATRRQVYGEAMRVGRDHVASTVNTLVLAYAGASLPLLLLFAQGSRPFGRLLTSEVVAVEVVRMLVGSIGLVASVPITTALAAAVLTADDAGGHVHAPPPERSTPASWDAFAPRDDT